MTMVSSQWACHTFFRIFICEKLQYWYKVLISHKCLSLKDVRSLHDTTHIAAHNIPSVISLLPIFITLQGIGNQERDIWLKLIHVFMST